MAEKMGMMAQYFAIKEQYKDAVVFFQVGGFYQVYYHDAHLAAEELGMNRISRAIGGGKRAPMCGFPIAGGEKYANRFAEKGYRVVICTQHPEKNEQGKNIRDVSKIVEAQGEAVNLSEAWDAYLENNTFEELNPPERKMRSSVERDRASKTKQDSITKQEAVVRPENEELLDELARLDLSNTTPLMAFNILLEWKESYIHGTETD